MNMKRSKQLPGIALLVLIVMTMLFSMAVLTNCGSDSDSGNADCAEFNPPAKTNYYGESCGSYNYGTCPTTFDDCAEGSCQSTKNGSVCTKSCSVTGDCPSALYCSSAICTPAATCTTFCDGTLCCSYYQDPNDPTSCKQGSCN